MSKKLIDNKTYWHYLFHKCLYYHHCDNWLSDFDFDQFEKSIRFTYEWPEVFDYLQEWGPINPTTSIIHLMKKEEIVAHLEEDTYPLANEVDGYIVRNGGVTRQPTWKYSEGNSYQVDFQVQRRNKK